MIIYADLLVISFRYPGCTRAYDTIGDDCKAIFSKVPANVLMSLAGSRTTNLVHP